MTFIDYFLGQPTQYDNNNQVVKRDFGIQNLLLIVFTAYVLYNLFGKNKNQRGGGSGERDVFSAVMSVVSIVIMVVVLGRLLLFMVPGKWARGLWPLGSCRPGQQRSFGSCY